MMFGDISGFNNWVSEGDFGTYRKCDKARGFFTHTCGQTLVLVINKRHFYSLPWSFSSWSQTCNCKKGTDWLSTIFILKSVS